MTLLCSVGLMAQTYNMAAHINMMERGKQGVAIALTGEIKNNGSQAVTAFDLNYQIGKAAIQTINLTGLNVGVGKNYKFNVPNAFTPSGPDVGKLRNIVVWASNIDGNVDADVSDDRDSILFLTYQGVSGTKNVLIEPFMSVQDGVTPDAIVKLDQVLANHKDNKVIAINYQSWGMMATFEGTDIITKFETGNSSALIDRYKFPQYTKMQVPRNDWEARVVERLNAYTPVNIKITNLLFNPNMDQAEVTAEFKFTDYVAGDIRVTAAIVEDWVTGGSQDYNQANNYNNNGSHPFYNMGDPIMGMYFHRVNRGFLSVAMGDWIDFSNPGWHFIGKDTTIVKEFTPRIIPVNYNRHQMHIVVFIAYYDDEDPYKMEVFNVVRQKLTNTDIEEEKLFTGIESIYPNPMENIGAIDFSLENEADVNLDIYNVYGQQVINMTGNTYAAGKHTMYFDAVELAAGSYLAVLNINGQKFTTKFIK